MEVPENDDLAFTTTDALLKELNKRFDEVVFVGMVWLDREKNKHEVAVLHNSELTALALCEIARDRILTDYKSSRKIKSKQRRRRKDDGSD